MRTLLLASAALFAASSAQACETVDGIMCGLPNGTYGVSGEPASNISFKVARIVDDAWKLMASQKFAAARDRLEALAKIAKKSPYEVATIADAVAYVDFSIGDYVGAAD